MAAYGKSHSSKNPLSAFLFFSSVVHVVILFIAFVIFPLIKPKPVIKMISFSLVSDIPSPATQAENPIPAPAPSPQPTQQATPTPAPVQTPQATTQPVRRKETLVARTPTPAPQAPAPVVQQPAPTVRVPAPTPAPPPTPAPVVQPPVQQPVSTPTPVRTASQIENDDLANQVDSLLASRPNNTSSPASTSSDFLAGGSWIGSPRKTIAFPNIKARIDELENQQGYGYSVTARITFTAQGWVSMVELTRASGDPRIDNIFRNELRKIRIEESRIGSVDTVIKSFVISVQ
ncbi:MAG: hypothetical protein ACRCY4_03720 [Brevinema sp.]